MAAGTAENLPIERFDAFCRPQDDYERAKEKAKELLRQVLPSSSWSDLEDKGTIHWTGRRGTYVISPYSQTEIRDNLTGRCIAYACLQLSIPAPTYDRMVAEYLLIRNSEDLYWKTANIFSRTGREFGVATLFLLVFDLALGVNLMMNILRTY